MQHNSTQPLGISKDIFYSGVNYNQFEMWELKGSSDANQLSVTVNIVEVDTELYKQTITLPEYNCIVFIKFNGNTMFIRVGEPVVELVSYSGDSTAISYKRITGTGSSIENGTLAYRGSGIHSYKPSDNNYSIVIVGNQKYSLDVPYSKCNGDSGTIKLQRGVWQLIAINRENAKVAEYLCDRLADQEGVDATELIEVVNTYRGSDDKFLSYVPGITSKASVNNFTLVYNDSGSKEIAGVWVKAKAWTHTSNDLIISWDNN